MTDYCKEGNSDIAADGAARMGTNLSSHLRQIGDPGTDPPDLWNEIRSRRIRGERVIVPIRVRNGLDRPLSSWMVAASIAVMLFGATWFMAKPRSAQATDNKLTFSPVEPTAGARIAVTYYPSSELSDQDTVTLRARYRTQSSDDYSTSALPISRVATLRRKSDGGFHGSFTLPPQVVYAAFAVESANGERIDSDNGRLWEILIHGSDRRPTFEALDQRYSDVLNRRWEQAQKTAEQMTSLYPDEPSAWTSTLRFAAPSVRDAAEEDIKNRLLALHNVYVNQPNLSNRIVRDMGWWRQLVAPQVGHYWKTRLMREFPKDPRTMLLRERHAASMLPTRDGKPCLEGVPCRIHIDSIDAYMRYRDTAEVLWREAAPRADQAILQNAWSRAWLYNDGQGMLRWGKRRLEHEHLRREAKTYFISQIGKTPGLEDDAIRLAHEHIDQWSRYPEHERDLQLPRNQYYRRTADEIRELRVVIGTALISKGDSVAGLATLRSATEKGWLPDAFKTATLAHLARGDTAMAREYLALLIADPEQESYADSVVRSSGLKNHPAWSNMVANARERLRRETMAYSTMKPLKIDINLSDEQGQQHLLRGLIGGQASVVMFWSPNCFFSAQELPNLVALNQWLMTRGFQLIVIRTDGDAETARQVLAKSGITFRTYYDSTRSAQNGFRNNIWPSYWVLDANGRILFERSQLVHVRRQILAVSTDS